MTPAPRPSPRVDPHEPGDAPAPVHRTLVVDDVADLRMVYRAVLEGTGRFEVVGEAADGQEAVARARSLQPDLVTLDVSMPERDGLEVLPEIREAAPGATVVMISGFESRRLGRLAARRGASAFLEKGLRPDQLVTELLRAMGEEQPPGSRTPCGPASGTPDVVELLAVVAHEVLNPLTVVGGLAETLRDRRDLLDEEQVVGLVGRIAARARELEGITRSMLELPALAAGEVVLETRPVLLGTWLEEVVAGLRGHHATTDIRLGVQPGLPAVDVDPDRLRQVVANVVSNAVRHSPAGAPVRIGAEAEGGGARVTVRDEGPGIPPADRERVFERFVRLDPGAGGIGLGLYVARVLVEAMGGRIGIADSEVGACVELRLPGVGQAPR